MKNIFDKSITQEVINRIENLTPETKGNWGSMSVGQMLAHCNVTYEMVYTDMHPKLNVFVKMILKAFVKKAVVSERKYSKGGKTAPQFIIKGGRDF